MSTLTIRLPDDTADRLKALAHNRGQSLNKLMEEMSAQVLAAYDTENRFRVMAAQGNVQEALAILDRLDGADANAAF
ncbi:MAG: ribbon-helix-helix protein, CopG family [Rhodocyclales bacterium]|nr:ribbon-helix-helix protein, CopG family [Rhodocyclales bacterium]